MVHLRQRMSSIQFYWVPLDIAVLAFNGIRADPLLRDQSEDFERRLMPHHKLVSRPSFETGIMKILQGNSEILDDE
jgi:hypothetical protein